MSEDKQPQINPIYQLKTPWGKNTHSVWLASTLSLHRNIAKYLFPAKLDQAHKEQIIYLLEENLKNCSSIANFKLFRSEKLSPLEKEFLAEHFMLKEGLLQAHGGEAFFIDETGRYLGIINLEDHLRLQITETEQELEKAWDQLIKIEQCFGKSMDFAFNPRFGFLTSDPAQCGTALIIQLFLHIPAIIHMGELSEILERESEDEVLALGIQGSSSEMIGDILVAQNSCTVGLTEEYLLTSLRMWATKVVVAEINARKAIKNSGSEPLKNKVARALGLLTHSYQLETVEALNALSLVKLGVELGWLTCPESVNINELFFNCRRAHLIEHLGGKMTIPEVPRKRADYLAQLFTPLHLNI